MRQQDSGITGTHEEHDHNPQGTASEKEDRGEDPIQHSLDNHTSHAPTSKRRRSKPSSSDEHSSLLVYGLCDLARKRANKGCISKRVGMRLYIDRTRLKLYKLGQYKDLSDSEESFSNGR